MNRFPDHARVCFVGDSITHVNGYLIRIVSHYKKNYPDSNINFYNCGIAGANLDEQLKIFEADTLSYNPTHIVMMIGINDSGREGLLSPRSVERYEYFKRSFERYKKNLSTICDAFKSKGVDITLCTCIPYDEYGDYCTAPLRGGLSLIMSYNEYIRKYAAENGFALCDYFPYMIEHMQTRCLYNADGVHPNDLGNYYIAKCFLAHQGLTMENDDFSNKLQEWNACVLKIRDILAFEYIVLKDHSMSYDEGAKIADAFLKDENNKTETYLCRLSEIYLHHKPNQSDIRRRMIELMEKEL